MKFRIAIIVISLTIVLTGCDECHDTEVLGVLHYYSATITSNSSLEYDLEQLVYLNGTLPIAYDSLGFVMSLLPNTFNWNGDASVDDYVDFDPDLKCFNQQQFKKIEIFSDFDYDENHSAGVNLIDVFSVIPNGETKAISIEEFLLKEDNGKKSVFILNSPPLNDGVHNFTFLIILEDEIGRVASFSSINIYK